MFINEIAKKYNITKKAVQYYVEQGLLTPQVMENGYNNFSQQDADKLGRIVLYRKLGLGTGEIKCVLADSGELTRILHKRTLELECEKMKKELLKRIEEGENVENLEKEINSIDANTVIIKKLMEMFPNYYGKFIGMNFARYLTGKIETEEQMQAFNQIAEFFDSVPPMEFPQDLQQYLDEYSFEEDEEKISGILEKRDEAIGNIEDFIKNNKDMLDKYKKIKQTDEFKNSAAFRLAEYMKQLCSANGYYDTFIPAMRKLSPQYNEYYEQLLKANELFLKSCPEYQG